MKGVVMVRKKVLHGNRYRRSKGAQAKPCMTMVFVAVRDYMKSGAWTGYNMGRKAGSPV